MVATDHIVWGDMAPVAAGMLQPLLTCHSERVEVYGSMSGRKSLCSGSVLKSGV
jgi:hypothetical protein